MKPNATSSPITALAPPSGGTIAVTTTAAAAGQTQVSRWQYEPDTDLTPTQHKAVAVLASGGTVVGAATAAGVDRVTVWRWRTGDAEFAAALNRALRDQADFIAAERRGLVAEAVTTIRELMGPGSPPALRLRAAVAALEAAGGITDPSFGDTNPADIKKAWDRATLFRALQ